MAAMPADADPLPHCPSHDTRSDRIDDAGDFVPRDSGVLNAGEGSLFGKRVAVADASGLDLDSYRAGARLWDFALHELKRPIRARHLDNPHFRHRVLRSDSRSSVPHGGVVAFDRGDIAAHTAHSEV